jgi:cobyrinic acid a,c-diamide synthase
MEIGRGAKESFFECQDGMEEENTHTRMGVLFDRAFNFYYPENLEALRQGGADLVFIDSLSDTVLPDIKGLYIGGGFPELFLGKLEANKLLRKAIKMGIEDGLPVYAECAGLMYLGKGIRSKGKYGEMVGVFPIEIEMDQKPQGHGYVEVEVVRENPFFPVGLKIHGHEFHHSKFLAIHDLKGIYRVHRGRGMDGMADGLVYKNVFAAYTHLHALGVPQWREGFLSLISKQTKIATSISNP